MRVLLVEDDPATAQGIEMMLRSESYVCDVTNMGEDGLEISRAHILGVLGFEVLRLALVVAILPILFFQKKKWR